MVRFYHKKLIQSGSEHAQITQHDFTILHNMHGHERFWDFLTTNNVKLLLHEFFDKPIENEAIILHVKSWLSLHAQGNPHNLFDYVRRNLNNLSTYTMTKNAICNQPCYKRYVDSVRGKPIMYLHGRPNYQYATRCKKSAHEVSKSVSPCNPLILQLFLTIENVRDFYNYMLERNMDYFPKCGNVLHEFITSLRETDCEPFTHHSLYELLLIHMLSMVSENFTCYQLHQALCEYVGYQQFIRHFPPTIYRLVVMMEQMQIQSCMIRDPHRGCFADPHRGCFADPHRGCFADPHRGCFADPMIILLADEYVMKHIVQKI
jgi:hypothetical protein